MGKIAERFAWRQRAKHALVRNSGPTVVDPARTKAAAGALKRGAALVQEIGYTKTAMLSVGSRHERMQSLADEAKDLGLKGKYMGLCNRTACLAPGADWYNRGSYAFYCEDCAQMLSHANRHDSFCQDEPLCRLVETAEEAATLHVTS